MERSKVGMRPKTYEFSGDVAFQPPNGKER